MIDPASLTTNYRFQRGFLLVELIEEETSIGSIALPETTVQRNFGDGVILQAGPEALYYEGQRVIFDEAAGRQPGRGSRLRIVPSDAVMAFRDGDSLMAGPEYVLVKPDPIRTPDTVVEIPEDMRYLYAERTGVIYSAPVLTKLALGDEYYSLGSEHIGQRLLWAPKRLCGQREKSPAVDIVDNDGLHLVLVHVDACVALVGDD